MKLPIVEMFFSTQGEGRRVCAAAFVRTGGCNFTCKGFGCTLIAPDNTVVTGCDTIRAVSTKFKNTWTYYDNWFKLVDDIDSMLPKYSKFNMFKPDIVFTGGETLLHWKNPVFQKTLSYFISRGHKVTIETNGTQLIEFNHEYQKQIMFSMSVKLAHSGELKEKRLKPDAITNIVENTKDSYLKFVVNPETWDKDFLEIKEFLKDIPVYVDVFLMPLGENYEQLQKNTSFVVNKCAELGFYYSDRIHIRANVM